MTQLRPRLLPALVPKFLLASFCLFWFSDTVADPDLWGHIRFGQDILRTGSIIQTDTYSYRTGGQPWMNHEWLSEVIFAAIYDRSGPTGLIVTKVVIALLIVGLCDHHLRHRGFGPFASVLLLVLISIPFRMGLGTVRPQVLTYLLFLLELLIFDRADEGGVSGLCVLPILFAAWVNLHGGVLAGLGVLGMWIAVRVIHRPLDKAGSSTRNRAAVVHLGVLAIACAMALMLNPYGADLIRFLLRTGTVPGPRSPNGGPWMCSAYPA